MQEAIAWQVLGQLYRSNAYTRAYMGVKQGQDRMVWPNTPWDDDKQQGKQLGSVASGDEAAAVDYLLALDSDM